jgi:Galactose oxidase, central domain
VMGGGNSTGSLSSAELFTPATGTFSRTGGMGAARAGFTATVLPDGQVLVAGGDEAGTATSSAELFNPATGTFSPTGGMGTARAGFTATLLPDGQVLAAGGEGTCVLGSCPEFSSAELYNPATGTWAPTGSMNAARTLHTATLLPSGQVLVAGGQDSFGANSTAELYNPATGKFRRTGSMETPRAGQLAGLLPDGQVLVVCGVSPSSGFPLCAAELYHPATGTWTDDGQAGPSAGQDFSATLLNTGQVFFSGGTNGKFPGRTVVSATATLFDPGTITNTATGSMTIPRAGHTLTQLPSGQVLATGGETESSAGKVSITASAELFTP